MLYLSLKIHHHLTHITLSVVAYKQTKTKKDIQLFWEWTWCKSRRSLLEGPRSLRVQIWFLYWFDIFSWMFQRHLKIGMCETELMIFSQTRSSFSVSYLSNSTASTHGRSSQNLKVVLYTPIFLIPPHSIHHLVLWILPL